MSSTKLNLKDEDLEITEENVIRGIETTLQELPPRLFDNIDNMSTKQLRRALRGTINYLATKTDDTEMEALKPVEQQFIGSMHMLAEMSIQYSIHILREHYKEQAEKEQQEQENENE